MQIERGIDQISEAVQAKLRDPLAEDFAVNLRRVDISDISLDTESEGYQALMNQGLAQADILGKQFAATGEATSRNILDQQQIGAENLAESLRINREETQRRQRLATESDFLTAHQIDVQGEVARTAAESLGELGGGMGGGDGLNPAGMMAGMMLGGAVGGHMAGMMGGMMQGLGQPWLGAQELGHQNFGAQPGMGQQPSVPHVPPVVQYFVAVNGAQSGPYTPEQLRQMIANRQVTAATYVWKQGMAGWAAASSLPELADAFGCVPPPPSVPPTL